MTQEKRFEERYSRGEIPWDIGRVDVNLAETVERRPLCVGAALDIGCGTGDNTVWLARRGFRVTGVDIAPLAIEKAREKAEREGVACRFLVADFLHADVPEGPFGFIFDRGCFHSLGEREKHERFARNVARHLGPGGLWLSLIASRDAPQRHPGPPRLSAAEVTAAVEPVFELLSLESGYLDSDRPDPIRCWVVLMKKRQA